jgi:hypothetical protein
MKNKYKFTIYKLIKNQIEYCIRDVCIAEVELAKKKAEIAAIERNKLVYGEEFSSSTLDKEGEEKKVKEKRELLEYYNKVMDYTIQTFFDGKLPEIK